MKLAMTIDEALEFADEWSKGLTLYGGAHGWRVVCMLLAEEVRRQHAGMRAIADHHDDQRQCWLDDDYDQSRYHEDRRNFALMHLPSNV